MLTIAGLVTGCAGPANNTQRGVAGGAALGALAGAVIGNNRGSGNAASGAAIGAAAGAIAGGAIGHSKDKRETRAAGSPYSTADQGVTNITVAGAPPLPPAPIAESTPPQPSSSAVWVPGYWSYENGTSYVWVPGRWQTPPAGYRTFQQPYWMQQGSGHVYVRGSWR